MTALDVRDVIDQTVGIADGDRLDGIRQSRPETRNNIQAAYNALFGGASTSGASNNGIEVPTRHLVAAFVAGLSDPGSAVANWHRERSTSPELVDELLESAAQHGPWGSYREPGLASESALGDWWQVPDRVRAGLGAPLVAVLEHAHFLVLHPRDARPKVLGRLAASGWSRAQIVTWSQLISFVSFQVRLAAGFTVLAGEVR